MIKVVVADDHNLVRQGIIALLEREKDIDVIGEASNGHEAILKCRDLKPDVLVTDINMPMLDGIQTIEQLRVNGLNVKVVILSMYTDSTLIKRAILEGAAGYLVKQSVTEELLLAIKAAARNEIYLSPSISKQILAEIIKNNNGENHSKFELLTGREREVLQLITEGYTNKDIATHLSISTKTVEKHRASIMKKLDVHDVPGLIRISIKHKLIYVG